MNDAVSLRMTMCSAVENLNLKFRTEVRTGEQHFDIIDFSVIELCWWMRLPEKIEQEVGPVAIYLSTGCWRTGKPGMLQSLGSWRVGHDLVTEWQQFPYLSTYPSDKQPKTKIMGNFQQSWIQASQDTHSKYEEGNIWRKKFSILSNVPQHQMEWLK